MKKLMILIQDGSHSILHFRKTVSWAHFITQNHGKVLVRQLVVSTGSAGSTIVSFRTMRFVFVLAHTGMYPGGGFIGLLGRHKLNSRSALDKLVQMKWFDRKTRAVFIEFTLYSAHAGLFSTVQLMYFRTAKDIRTNYRVSLCSVGLPPYYLRLVRNTFQLMLPLYPECTVQFHLLYGSWSDRSTVWGNQKIHVSLGYVHITQGTLGTARRNCWFVIRPLSIKPRTIAIILRVKKFQNYIGTVYNT